MYSDRNYVNVLTRMRYFYSTLVFSVCFCTISSAGEILSIVATRMPFNDLFGASFRSTIAPSSRCHGTSRETTERVFFTSRCVSGPLGGEFLQQRSVLGRYGRRLRHRWERRRRRGRQSSGCLAFPPRLIIARHPVAVTEPTRGHQQSHRQTVHDAE